MGRFNVLYKIFMTIFIILGDALFFIAGYNYAELKFAGEFLGASAPPSTALLIMIPFFLVDLGLFGFALYFKNKHEKEKKELG